MRLCKSLDLADLFVFESIEIFFTESSFASFVFRKIFGNYQLHWQVVKVHNQGEMLQWVTFDQRVHYVWRDSLLNPRVTPPKKWCRMKYSLFGLLRCKILYSSSVQFGTSWVLMDMGRQF